ncbi:MAG: DUF2244 domain-containing protein [Pseudomonadota bacterium]
MPNAVLYEDMPPDRKGRALEPPAPAPEEAGEAPLFDAVLLPNRSLPNAGFIAIMTVVCVVNFSAGLLFYLKGAWPVLGFCGLDVALVYIAFKVSYRQGRLRERVVLTADRLDVQRVLPSGHESRWSLQPYWTRLVLDHKGEHEARVRLVSRGRSLVLGSFLSPAEREAFGEALGRALGASRSAP